MSDKTDLASRATALKLKILKQHAAATTVSKKSSIRNKTDIIVKDEIESSVNVKSDDEQNVFAVERDFSAVLASTAYVTTSVVTSSVSDGQVSPEAEVKSGRKSRSKRTSIEPNDIPTASAPAIASEANPETITEYSNMEGTALPVLCLINILPVNESTTTTTTHSVLDVLYNTLLREIVHSPHAANAVFTDVSLSSESTVVTKVETSTSSPTKSGFALTVQEPNNSEVGKRKLSNTTTTLSSASKLSKSHTVSGTSANNNSAVAWACTVCTFLNTTERFCSMCMTARVVTVPKVTNNSSSASKLMRSSTTNSISVFAKATAIVSKAVCSSISSTVVDLVSDDDEVEIVDIITPAEVHSASSVPESSQKLIPVAKVKSNIISTVATVTKEFTTDTTLVSKPSVPIEIAPLQAHLDAIYTTMQLYLQSLVTVRRTTARTATTSMETISLTYELNLTEMDGEGEEEDDLLLLGLLPDIIQYKTDEVVTEKEEHQRSVNGSFNSRPSLEDLIPAPPFFVVTGKRTGDPASRKGKSKFCGKSISSVQYYSTLFVILIAIFYKYRLE